MRVAISPIGHNKTYNSPIKVNKNTTPIQKEVAFTGSKTNILAGIASGLVIGYYALAGIVLPPGVKNVVNNQLTRKFEYEALETIVSEDEQQQEELIEKVKTFIEEKPEETVTKNCLDILDKYELLNDSNDDELIETINDAIKDKKLDKSSKKFYIEYLDTLDKK